jgi:hypothetical protein
MATLDEIGRDTGIRGALTGAVEGLDLNQEIEFVVYTRVVLPLDGYVFWLPTGTRKKFRGSLHYSQEIEQNEDETVGLATVQFTSEGHIEDFSAVPPNTLYVAKHGTWRYAFSQQTWRYEQAGIYHYYGQQITPALASQLLDKPDQIDPDQVVVSNSLPIWLSLNGYVSPFVDGFSNPGVTLYPSFAVPPNLPSVPPYGSVHIEPSATQALTAAPYLSPTTRSHYQLCEDTVRITLYGMQNNAALDFIDMVNAFSVNYGTLGIMNIPTVRDGKRTQPAIEALAMQKVIDFRVSYYQSRVNEIARQLIKIALVTFQVNPQTL